jgi:hypothetical protein
VKIGRVEQEQAKPRRFRIDFSDLALEVVSIVIAIVLATAVGEWRQSLREHAEVVRALGEIRQEIAGDRARLATSAPLHRAIAASFRRLLETNGRTETLTVDQFGAAFRATAPHGIMPFFGVGTAWQVARDTGTAAHLDYPLLTKLETAYATQDILNGYRDRLVADFHVDATSAKPNFYFVAENFDTDFTDLTANEADLLRYYDEALAALDAQRNSSS